MIRVENYGISQAYQELLNTSLPLKKAQAHEESLHAKEQLIATVLEGLETFASSHRFKLIQDAALQPSLSHQWKHFAQLARTLKKESYIDNRQFQNILKITREILHDARANQKIIQLCNKHHIEYSDYKNFMSEFDEFNPNPSTWLPLTKAVAEKREDMVGLLVEAGENLDQEDPNGDTPIMVAVYQENKKMLTLLKDLGANLNFVSSQDWTPLVYAMDCGSEKMIRHLKLLGADINFMKKDNKYTNPLFMAAINYKSANKVKLVRELGADIHLRDSHGTSLMDLLLDHYREQHATYKDHQLVELLEALDLDINLIDEQSKQNFLSLVWGIGGSSSLKDTSGSERTFTLVGSKNTYTMPRLLEYVREFFASPDSTDLPISKENRKKIQDALANTVYADTKIDSGIIDKIKSGQPVVIMGGTTSHCIAMVIAANQLIVCNRGEGKIKNGAEIYAFPASKINAEIITRLTSSYEDTKSFNQMILDLNLTYLRGHEYKDQKVGNCSLAGSKAVFGELCCLFTDHIVGRKIYKRFTAFLRERVLENYLAFSNFRDKTLLKKIEVKVNRKRGFSRIKKLLKDLLATVEKLNFADHDIKSFGIF